MKMKFHYAVLFLSICVIACHASHSAEEKNLLDFGKEDPSSIFNEPQGGLVFSLEDNPAGKDGKVLTIKSPARGFLYTKSGFLPGDLQEYESISIDICRSSGDGTAVLEIQFIEEGGRAKFWRKVEVGKEGQTKAVVPLRFMRQSNERTPSWRNVKHMGFFFRDRMDISLAGISLLCKTGRSAVITAEELAEIAFPDSPAEQRKLLKEKDFIIASNSSELDIGILGAKMKEVLGKANTDFSRVKLLVPDSPPTLLVFATREEYMKFTPRFAELLLGTATPPASGGYTVHSIATSSWEQSKGTLRPVFFHEMLHSWLDKACGFPSANGDWIQEGFANYYQLMFFPQDDLWKIILNGISAPKMHMPLKDLCNGRRIPMDRYWQALTVIAMIQGRESYRDKLPKLIEALLQKGSTDLNPVVSDVFGVSMDKFSSDWKEFCAEYAKSLNNK